MSKTLYNFIKIVLLKRAKKSESKIDSKTNDISSNNPYK